MAQLRMARLRLEVAPAIHSLPRPAHRVRTMPFRCRAQRGAWAWAADLRKASHPLICPLRRTATTKWNGIECRTSLHPEAIAAGRSCAPIHLAATQARLGQRGCWLAGDGANHACAALLTTGFEPATKQQGIEAAETANELAGRLDGACRFESAGTTRKFPIEKDYIRFCQEGANFKSPKKPLSATSLLPPASSTQVDLHALGNSTEQS